MNKDNIMINVDNNPDYINLVKLISEGNSVDGHKMGDLESRIDKMSSILQKNSDLREDSELTGLVWTFSEQNEGPAIQKIREILLYDTSCNIGTLTASKEKLEEFGCDLWDDVIKKHHVKKLIIQREGYPIEYNERVLRQLVEKKPPIGTLIENSTLKFVDGEVKVTHAHLLLCGEYFEVFITGPMMKDKSVMNFTKMSMLSIESFSAILNEVKTGQREFDKNVYKSSSDYYIYDKWTGCPKGAFGPDQWEEYYDIKVDDVPIVPQNILDRIEALKKEGASKKAQLIFVPKGMSLGKMGKLAKNPKSGNKTKYRSICKEIEIKHGKEEAKKSHWALIATEVIGIGKDRATQLEMAREKKGYDAPSLLEAVILNFTTFVATKKRLFNVHPLTYTVCKENPIDGYKLMVGGFAPAGLYVSSCSGYGLDGVALVLREF